MASGNAVRNDKYTINKIHIIPTRDTHLVKTDCNNIIPINVSLIPAYMIKLLAFSEEIILVAKSIWP